MDNQLTYIILGSGIYIVLFIGYKWLRKPRNYWTVLPISFGLAAIGYLNLDRPALQMINGNAAYWFYLPILFMIYFRILRRFFIKVFDNEPLMTGYMQLSWNQGEYRKLHYGDAFFTIANFLLPFLTIVLIP